MPKKISIFLLTIVTNELNLFQIALILRWAKIDLEVIGRMFFRMFCGFDIGCSDDVDVEIFDSSEPDNCTSIKFYTGPFTKSSAILYMFADFLKFHFYNYQKIVN